MEGKIHRLEVLMKHQSGDQIWVDIGGSPLVENTEEILFMATDITDKKKAEEIRLRDFEIRTQNEHLQETNRLKNEFLANMSHELRTQLAGILGYAEILKKAARTEQEIPEETYKKYVDGIIVGGSNLLGLIQTQLDYVKVESDKMAFYADGVFLDDIINEVVYIKSKKAKEKNIQIHVVCTEHYKIMSDALRIRQILSILLDNAIQFSMREKNIHVRSIKLPGDSFEIDIEDQGIGIGIADYERIFYPFYQVSSGLSKTYGGAGMGLALARKIARAMGGDITVKSMPSVGSTFVLKLPISQLT
jgi:signal transduction histidine kinase